MKVLASSRKESMIGWSSVKKYCTIMASIFFLTFVTATISFATPYWVEVDVSSIAGSDIELEIDLFENSGIVGDSWAFIDNVQIGGPTGIIEEVDFEDGTLQGFDDTWNPAQVNIVTGDWWSENWMMQIDEASFTPTITYRDFLPSSATTLHMEFEFISDGTVGPFGQDALVASLLDPVTLNPLITGLTGSGDFLETTASGNSVSPEVTGIEPIPEPTTILLMSCGLLGLLGIGIRHRKKK
jgi:hypothetical protein